MELDERDEGRSVDVGHGELLVVRLKETPTTGYRWAVEAAGGLEQESDRNAAASGAPGAAMLREFRFRASQRGNAELRLKCWREWQGDASVTGRFSVQVRVD